MAQRGIKCFFWGIVVVYCCGMGLVGDLMGQEQKRIYIANDDHTDYMWAADEATYQAAFIDMIDYYLNLSDATSTEPTEFQSRWNCDGSFWVWTYEQNKPSADFNRLISRIRDGHISVPLTALVSCYGAVPSEAAVRGMYYAGRIERRYGLRFRMAESMENQTLPYGLGALWAGAGAKYSWYGICDCATTIASAGQREHEIYWWVGPDGSRILTKWYSMTGSNTSLGGYAEARDPDLAVDLLDAKAGNPAYPFYVAGAFGKGWDDLVTLTSEFVTVAKAKTTSSVQVIVSNEEDFFQDFEAAYGSQIPSVSVTFGNEWDLYSASMAEVTSKVRRSIEKLRAAEALATLVSREAPMFMTGRETARDLAWMDLGLYWEHDWTADGPVSRAARAAWQRRLAGEIADYVGTLYSDAATSLGGMIRKSGSNLRFFAFNPLSWTRSGVAEIPYADSSPFHVVDLATSQETPSQIVTIAGARWLRILAEDVPPIGYKVFEVRWGAGQSFADAAQVVGSAMENDYYRITVAGRGAITSLVDKQRGDREFVRQISGRSMNDLGSSTGTIGTENVGPVSVTFATTAALPIAHSSRITLVRNSRSVEIQNDILANFGGTYSWDFCFELNNPDVWHEEVGAVIRAKLISDGGQYSTQTARYDWLTLNHFADISDSSHTVGVTLSNTDCSFMQLGNSTVSTLDVTTPRIAPLAGGQVDGAIFGIPNQGGDTNFLQRFALATHDAYDPVISMEFAMEHQNPLVAGVVTGGTEFPESSYSLLTVSDPSVLAWAIKPAEEGIDHGIIVRLWNLASTTSSLTLSLSDAQITSASHISHVETTESSATVVNGQLQESVHAHQIKTFRLLSTSRAAISALPTSFSIQCEADGARSTATLSISNTTSGVLMNYTISTTSTAWLSCTPTTGTSAGEVTTHTVSIDPAGLSAGDYPGTIRIISAQANNSPFSVPVAVHVLLLSHSTVDRPTTPQANLDLPDWNTTESQKMSVLKFRITDYGGDSLPTLIDRIRVEIGGTAGHAGNDIVWAELVRDATRVALASSITDSQIVFGVTPNNDSAAQLDTVAESIYREYTIYVYLSESLQGTHDQTYEFRINESFIGVDGGASSQMAGNRNRVAAVIGTLFITELGITVSPNSWIIGPRPLNAVLQSSPFTVANAGNVSEDFLISGSDGAGGWLLSVAAGPDAFRVDVDRENDGSYDFVLAKSEQTLATSVGSSGGSSALRLKYTAPASDTRGAGVDQHFIVTLRASRHVP